MPSARLRSLSTPLVKNVPWLAGALATVFGAATVHAQPFVYVANADSDDVTVIDAATNGVATTIGVGSEPRNPAVSHDGTRVYVPNRHDDTVTVIDGVTNSVITTIVDDDFEEPYSAAVSPDGTRVYVANKFEGGSMAGSLTVIDATTNMVLTTVDDACFVSPEWVVLNPVGTRAYVVNRQGDSVCVVDTASNMVLASVPVGGEPRSAVVTCDGAFVYVANNAGSPSITKIDTSDNSTIGIDFTSGFPRNMAITPDCSKIYVPLQIDMVGLILTASDATSLINVPDGDSTYGAAVIFDGSLVYVTDEDDDEVEVIDAATDSVISDPAVPIPAGFAPRGIASSGGTVPQATPTATATGTPTTTATPTPTRTATPTPFPTPQGALRHFQCYEVDRRPFAPFRDLTIADALGAGSLDLRRPKRLCAPADKNGEDPGAPADPAHLLGYEIRNHRPRFAPVRNVEVRNQLGTITVELLRADILLVPTAKSLTEPPAPLGGPLIDHFQCYRTRGATTRVAGVTIIDQFGALRVDVKRPMRLCLPVDKNGEGIVDPTAHLLCYWVRQNPRKPRFGVRDPMFIANQLESATIALTRPTELCVPSTVVVPAS